MSRRAEKSVIEHNLDVIKCADWLVDLGPAGGEDGGPVIAEGTPEEIARVKESYTAQFLARVLAAHLARARPGPGAAQRAGRTTVGA